MSTIQKARRYLGARLACATGLPINRPLHLELIITSRCSLRCPHCDSWKVPIRDELSVGQWTDVVRRANEWLGPVPIYVAGGEPFVVPGVGELLHFITDRGNPLFIMTNGQHELVEADYDSILVSIYSLDPALHDAIRSSPGSHRKAMAFLEGLLARDAARRDDEPTRVNVAFLITSENYREMPRYVDFFSRRGVHTSFMVLRNNPLDVLTSDFGEYDRHFHRRNPLWVRDVAGLECAVRDVVAQKRAGLLVNNYEGALHRYVDYYRDPESVLSHPCHMPALCFTVDPTGDVRICFYSAKVGNVLREHPREIWRSGRRAGELGALRSCTGYCRIHSNYNFLCWTEKAYDLWSAAARRLVTTGAIGPGDVRGGGEP